MDDCEGVAILIIIAIVFVAGIVAGHGCTWEPAYRCGQADAISGNYHYMLTYKPDGGAEWIKLDKPTTQPVITRAK